MTPPAPYRPRSSPALMEELVEEILLRIPPDDPAHLMRAALVCKPWRRILTDPGFLRRYHASQRPPPLLGYFHNLGRDNRAGIPPFALTLKPSPLSTTTTLPPELERTNWVLDCRHGRVLIHAFAPQYYLVVWDPITGGRKNLSLPDYPHVRCAGAVLCSVDGCDHLNCHHQDGPFRVVFAGSGDDDGNELETWVSIYSSETGQWSASISVLGSCFLQSKPPLLIGDTLYFRAEYNILLKCDIGAHQELSLIESPGGFSHDQHILMELDGGGLGFVSMEGNCLYLFSWQGGDASGWAQDEAMGLETILPTDDPFCPHDVVGLMEGTYTVFINVSDVGLFAFDLKSKEAKKVGERAPYYATLPYTGFYTPDLAKGRRHHLQEGAMIDPPT